MYSPNEILNSIKNGSLDGLFETLYENAEYGRIHIEKLINGYINQFGDDKPLHIFSAPGRVELGGNHTDHQHGKVLAASVSFDTVAAAAVNEDNIIRVISEGFGETEIDLASALTPRENERGTTAAFIRGIAARICELGGIPRGFNAYIRSDVPAGSGLSSSAAFAVLIGGIINTFFCDNHFTPLEIAKISSYAENVYFGKPSGLMDQCASAIGGVIAIDFKDVANPIITKTVYDFEGSGYSLFVIDSGADHADLSDEYASITRELSKVSAYFGKTVLREVSEIDFYTKIRELRESAGDRAVLRAMHVFDENQRVEKLIEALENKDFFRFLGLIKESGYSSTAYLQNITPYGSTNHQNLALTLALCGHFLGGKSAYRVHGGGFAGTALAFVPVDEAENFCAEINRILGHNSCKKIKMRDFGFIQII